MIETAGGADRRHAAGRRGGRLRRRRRDEDGDQGGPERGGDGSSGEATATATAAEGGSGAALAEGEGSSDGARFRFSLTELKRSGPTVVANATVTWIEGGDDNLQIAGTFGDGVDASLEGDAPEPHDTFDGIALIDPGGP